MKNLIKNDVMSILILVVGLLISTSMLAQEPDHTFSYQGELLDNGVPANGDYDIVIKAFDSALGGSNIGSNSTHLNVTVENGLFSLSNVNVGDVPFDGLEVWFNVDVRKVGEGTFDSLSPRQLLHAVPFAAKLTNGFATQGQVYTFDSTFGWAPADPANPSPWTVAGSNINFTTGEVAIGSQTSSALLTLGVPNSSGGDIIRAMIGTDTAFYVDDNGGVGVGSWTTPPINGLEVEGVTNLNNHVLIDGNLGINSGDLLNSTLQAAVHIEATSSEGKALFVSSNFGQYGADITLGGNSSSGSQDEGVITTDLRYAGSDMWLISNDAVVVRLDQDNNEMGHFEIRQSTNSTVFSVDENGVVVQNGSTIHASDKRLKKDIQEIPYGLAEIMVLQPKAYNWKSHEQQYKSFGLIAQDVQPIMQEVVNVGEDKEKTLGISYTELIPVLIKAVQEQQAIIEQQDKKIERLINLMENRK